MDKEQIILILVQNFINDAKKKKIKYLEKHRVEIRSYIHVKDVAKITYQSLQKKYDNNYYNIFGKKDILVRDLLNKIKEYIPNLEIKYAKKDIKKYNYKKNPFTYKLRNGKKLKLQKYISLDEGIKNLIK